MGFEDVYVNYLAFPNNDMCSTIKVWVDEFNRYAIHPAMICYIRKAIIADDELNEPAPYKQIAIFPETTNKMIIFTSNPRTNVYNCIDIMDNIRWISYKNIDPVVFEISVPKSYNTTAMYNELRENVQNLVKNKYVKSYSAL